MTIFPSPLYAPAMKCRRLGFIVPLALALLVAPLVAEAQQVRKVPRVGYLGNVSSTPPDEAFHAGLRELGWVEGRNMVVERRYAEDRYERLPGLAAELVQLHVEVIVAGAGPAMLSP